MEEGVSFISDAIANEEQGGLLVHCMAGQSRSVTMVIAYLIKIENYTLGDAIGLIKNSRPTISPNPGFMI